MDLGELPNQDDMVTPRHASRQSGIVSAIMSPMGKGRMSGRESFHEFSLDKSLIEMEVLSDRKV